MLFFKKDNIIKKVIRDFKPNYFLSEDIYANYIKNGYVIVRNIVKNEQLQLMQDLYIEISKMNGFELNDLFLNSGRLESPDIRNIIVNNIKKVSKDILIGMVRNDVCEIETGGAFQIKPPSNKSVLNPHQDTPIVDENNFYAVYVWIPLCNTDSNNGCLSVLPESHLWGNFQRSLNVPWKYEKSIKSLWKSMVDIPTNRGDLILFDSALIHASKPNLSNKTRIAFTSAILPIGYQLIHYYRDNYTPKNKVEVYAVDEYFFSNEDITKRPNTKYKLLRLEDWFN